MTHVECPFCKGVVGVERAGAFRCPACGGTFSVELPDAPAEPAPAPPPPVPALPNAPPCARHATSPAVAVCGRCGNFVCAACATSRAQGVFCPECAEKLAAPGEPVPWEDPRRAAGPALLATIRLAFRDGRDLVGRVPRSSGFLEPFKYALLLSIPCGVAGEIVELLVDSATGRSMATDEIVWSFVAIGLTPLLLPLVAAFQHLCVRIAGGAGPFDTTWRLVCYSSSYSPLNVVPYVGPIVSAVKGLILQYRGYVIAHRMTWLRALLALIVLPLVFLAAIGIFVAICVGVILAILS